MSKPTLAQQLEGMADWSSSGNTGLVVREPTPDNLLEIAGEVKKLEAALHLADEANIRCLGPEVIVADVRVGAAWPDEARQAVDAWQVDYDRRRALHREDTDK